MRSLFFGAFFQTFLIPTSNPFVDIENKLNISSNDIFFISAATGEGIEKLLKSLETAVINNNISYLDL